MIDYSQIAAQYAQHRRVHPEVLRKLIENLTPASRILEVGCGTGNYISAISESTGCSCWGVDLSQSMLAQARQRSSGIEYSLGRAESLPLPDDQFDFVYSVDVIHHVIERQQAIQEARRVLRDGGRLCIVTDSPDIIRRREVLSVYFPETVAIELVRYPAEFELKNGLQTAGFVAITEETVKFGCELADIQPFRDKLFSCLQLITKEAFQRGLTRLSQDLLEGPIKYVSRYSMICGTKPTTTT